MSKTQRRSSSRLLRDHETGTYPVQFHGADVLDFIWVSIRVGSLGAAGKKSGVFPLIRFMFDREELRAALTEGEIEEEIRRHRRTLSKKDEKRIRVYGDVRLQLLGTG